MENSEYRERRGPTKTLSLRVEPELIEEFSALKRETSIDIPEAQRIALRKLAAALRAIRGGK